MLGFEASSVIDKPALSSNRVAFMDPHIGLYCLSLASKSNMRNAIGEQNAAILCRLATFMTATAFSRCGLPVSASFLSFLGFSFTCHKCWTFCLCLQICSLISKIN